jgi:hypothetical protein
VLKDIASAAGVQWNAVDTASLSAAPTLPADRTFVVQFRASPDQTTEDGRVEHLVSGRAARFDTWAELRDFVEHVLVQAASTESVRRGGGIVGDEGGPP